MLITPFAILPASVKTCRCAFFRQGYYSGKNYLWFMAVLKNVQFSKLIKAEGRLREFNFRKSNGIVGPVYHVDVSDDRGNRYYLNLLLEQNTWTVQEKNLPPWIQEAVAQFHPAIQEQEV